MMNGIHGMYSCRHTVPTDYVELSHEILIVVANSPVGHTTMGQVRRSRFVLRERVNDLRIMEVIKALIDHSLIEEFSDGWRATSAGLGLVMTWR